MSDVHTISGRQSRETIRTLIRDLRCDLTQEEIRERGEELARLQHEQETILDHHKAQKARMRELESDLATSIRRKAYDVRTRSEERAVECQWEADYVRDRAVLVRTDTGEEIDDRPLTEDERQRTLL